MKSIDNIKLISEQTGIAVRELNRLNQDYWYHGTTVESAENIQKQGVIIDYNVGIELDFGPGFYLTDTHLRASTYMSKLPIITEEGNLQDREEWAVIEFEFNPYELLFSSGSQYSYKNYPKHNEEFANFVLHNRTHNVYKENPHNFDIIWGIMSDSNPKRMIEAYRNNVITRSMLIKHLQKPNSMRQLYIGNQRIGNLLRIHKIIKEGTFYDGTNS